MQAADSARSPGAGVILPELVTTQRLGLRRWRPKDAPLLGTANAESIDHLQPWMAWIAFEPATLDDRTRLIDGWEQEWQEGGDVVYGVRFNGEVVGGAGLHRRSGPGTLDIGYWIHTEFV